MKKLRYQDKMMRVFYKKVDDVEFDSMDVMSSSFNLFGLEHSSLYNLYVSSICSNGELKNSDTIMFKTLCSQINTFPYVEDFENYILHQPNQHEPCNANY